jgi:hypothetical protein
MVASPSPVRGLLSKLLRSCALWDLSLSESMSLSDLSELCDGLPSKPSLLRKDILVRGPRRGYRVVAGGAHQKKRKKRKALMKGERKTGGRERRKGERGRRNIS